MVIPKRTSNETERLKELLTYDILGTIEEREFDFITEMASEICETKISLISLVTADKQWFKSHHGLEVRETPKDYSFCAHAIHNPNSPFIVKNARKDERFFDNPLVTGDPYIVSYVGIPLVTEKGHALGTLCIIDDKPKSLSKEQLRKLRMLTTQVTHLLELRKKASELERKSQIIEKASMLFSDTQKLANIGVWEMDLGSGEIHLTDQMYEIFELDRQGDYTISTILDIYHPSDQEIIKSVIEKTISSDVRFDVSLRLLTSKNTIKWVRTSGRVWRGEKKKHKLDVVVQDISETKEAQLSLAKSEQYYKSLVRSIPDLMFVLTKEGVFLDFYAQNFDKRLYVMPEDFLGKNIADVLPKPVAEQFLKSFQQLEIVELVEIRYSLPIQGTLKYFHARIVNIDKDKIIILSTDDTDRTKSIANLELLVDVTKEQNDRLKNYAHIVSHNLRAHSGSLSLLLDFMKEDYPEIVANELFKKIEQVSNNLSNTIENLNDVVEINTERNEKFSALNIRDQLTKIIESIQALADGSDVRIFNEIDSDMVILSIPAYTQSIILNLLTNAIKYKRKQEQPSFVRVYAERKNNTATVYFEDNGIGIDLKKHGHEVFGMYKTFTDNVDAKEIGLFICKSQIEAMGGSITVESQLGKGSTFTVTFQL